MGILDQKGEEINMVETAAAATMTTMEVEAVRQLKEIFRRFDLDSDGSLTHLELAAFLRSLGLSPTGDQLHSLIARLDSNHNGTVEFDELLQAIAPEIALKTRDMVNEDDPDQRFTSFPERQEKLIELFRAFDQDGNGFITAAELARAMAKLGHALTLNELAPMIREADTDGDGVISFAEFAVVMARSESLFFSS